MLSSPSGADLLLLQVDRLRLWTAPGPGAVRGLRCGVHQARQEGAAAMPGFSVDPETLTRGGRRMTATADEVAGLGAELRGVLSALGAASGHPGVAAAAEDAAAAWWVATQAWAAGGAVLGDAVVQAAAAYADVDARQVQRPGGPQP
jgi:hypothetical protein